MDREERINSEIGLAECLRSAPWLDEWCDARHFRASLRGSAQLKLLYDVAFRAEFSQDSLFLQETQLKHIKVTMSCQSDMRVAAVQLSRTGKSLQNPARQQRPDPDAPPEPEKPERRINRAIVSRTIRLITQEGHKILTRQEALRHAENMDLDLVEVDGKQDPPVCKLMDFNKERFKEKRREKELKKKQSERRRLDDLKEVRFSTRTAPRDLELKAQMALRLLTRGHRVKLAVVPHGNDDLEPKGRELLDRMVILLQDSAKVETGPRIEKQRAWVLVRPISVVARGGSTKKGLRAIVESGGGVSASDSEDDNAS